MTPEQRINYAEQRWAMVSRDIDSALASIIHDQPIVANATANGDISAIFDYVLYVVQRKDPMVQQLLAAGALTKLVQLLTSTSDTLDDLDFETPS